MKEPFELPEERRIRMTQNEMSTTLMLLNAFSMLFGAEKSLDKRFAMIPDGAERFLEVKAKTEDLMNDIIGTITDQQLKRLRGVMHDYEIRAIPKLTPESRNVIIDKDQLAMIVDEARQKCVGCVEEVSSCGKCRLYRFLEAYTPLDNEWNGWLCPYSNADWE